jgi:oligopeptide/dipeptide ABC transporter ATP-binding protein
LSEAAPSPAAPGPTATADAALEVADLRIVFETPRGPFAAVDGVSFRLSPGRTLGLVGESGSGKTMTALATLDLLPPTGRVAGGHIRFQGQDIGSGASLRGDRIAMIFQEPATALNPVMTIGEQVAEPWIIHRGLGHAAAMEAAVALLDRVGLPDAKRRAQDYPHRLSGGQRQRAMIAMALACDPALLIADEPTTALDVTIQAQILDLMLELQDAHGMAMLFISHNLAVVSEIADDVAVMYAGRIVEQAPAAELFAAPRHPYTRGLLDTLPRLGRGRGRLPAVPGHVPDPSQMPPGCRFAPRCPLADDGCRAADPQLRANARGHAVACFKADMS